MAIFWVKSDTVRHLGQRNLFDLGMYLVAEKVKAGRFVRED